MTFDLSAAGCNFVFLLEKDISVLKERSMAVYTAKTAINSVLLAFGRHSSIPGRCLMSILAGVVASWGAIVPELHCSTQKAWSPEQKL